MKSIKDLNEVLALWKDKASAPQRILQHIEYFARVGVRSSITKLLDVEFLRQQIVDALASALPTTRTCCGQWSAISAAIMAIVTGLSRQIREFPLWKRQSS